MNVTEGAVNVIFDRLSEYLPPPVYVKRTKAIVLSLAASLVVLILTLRPALALRESAMGDPLKELLSMCVVMGCVIMTLLLQRTVASFAYSLFVNQVNQQHVANAHWISEYARAARSSSAIM